MPKGCYNSLTPNKMILLTKTNNGNGVENNKEIKALRHC